MTGLVSTLLLGALSVLAPAWADPPPEEEDQERIFGDKPPPLEREPEQKEAAAEGYTAPTGLTHDEYAARPYPNITYIGAEALQMDPEYVHGIQQGLELLYKRDYKGTREHFEALDKQFPDTAVAAVVDTLVWQALMLENFDFKFDKQYWVSTERAREELEAAMEKPGNDAWEHFLSAGIVGIESIHTMRRSQYLKALQLAFDALDHIQKARELAPKFTDLTLADGMYNYWRTVVTMNSSILPDFADKRVEGIEQMQEVERAGIFLSSPATLSLAFTWLEQGEYKRAIGSCVRNRKDYPDNIINNLVTGTTFIYMRKYSSAIGVFDEILEDAPKNKRVRYWKGVALLRQGKLDLAEAEFQTYLGFDYMEDYQRANAHYRMGQLNYRRKAYPAAYESYKTASKLSGHKSAKRALDRMKEAKKKGRISY